MNVKAVLRNIQNKGLKETLEIRNTRETLRKTENSDAFKYSVIEGKVTYLLEKLKDTTLSEKKIADIKKQIEKLEETEGYVTFLRKKYVKSVLPMVYDLNKDKPIENKMLFMQPRIGLNQSCTYMFKTIQKQGKYEPILFELQRDISKTLYYLNAVKWVEALATARACFVHESNELLGYIDIRKETKIVQLWHGCGIIKKIGLSTMDMMDFKSKAAYTEFPEYNKYDIVTIPSAAQAWIYEEFMGLPKGSKIIQPIGVSRTDEFFDPEYVQRCYDKIHKIIPETKEKKIILYAPTYRGLNSDRVAPDALNIPALAKALSDKYILILKHHQTAQKIPEIPAEYKDTFAFNMTRGKGMRINELMTVADICISDYSSLVFEFALFERPIMAFAYDLKDYIDNRGLYYKFEDIIPGPICKTNEEMIDYIVNIDTRFDKQRVIDFKNEQMTACDGHSTQRILDWIENN